MTGTSAVVVAGLVTGTGFKAAQAQSSVTLQGAVAASGAASKAGLSIVAGGGSIAALWDTNRDGQSLISAAGVVASTFIVGAPGDLIGVIHLAGSFLDTITLKGSADTLSLDGSISEVLLEGLVEQISLAGGIDTILLAGSISTERLTGYFINEIPLQGGIPVTATAQDFTMYAGDSKALVVTVADKVLTGASVIFKMAPTRDSTAVITKTTEDGSIVLTAPATGELTIALYPVDTLALSGKYYFEVQVTDSDGDIATVTTGKCKINQTLIP
jgi:hypothetical protein